MREPETMKEVAEVFQMAPSALRYWDSQGLIRFERGDNQYRYPTYQTLMDICEVAFYRDLSLPIRDIRALPGLNAAELEKMLASNEIRLRQELLELEKSIEKIRVKRSVLLRLNKLTEMGFHLVSERFPAVKPFSFHDREAVQLYIQDPFTAVTAVNPENPGEIEYGMIAEGTGKELIKREDKEKTPYLKGVFQVETDCQAKHNTGDFVAAAKDAGYQPGMLYGRFLITLCEEGVRYDYYEGWMALEPCRRL